MAIINTINTNINIPKISLYQNVLCESLSYFKNFTLLHPLMPNLNLKMDNWIHPYLYLNCCPLCSTVPYKVYI